MGVDTGYNVGRGGLDDIIAREGSIALCTYIHVEPLKIPMTKGEVNRANVC